MLAIVAGVGVWLGTPELPRGIDVSEAPAPHLPLRVEAPEAGSMRQLTAGEVAYLKSVEGAPRTNTRSLARFLDLRAYSGAPPEIPHEVELTGNEKPGEPCLGCHRNGGYAVTFKAFTPTTPHPELVNCLQCHAEQNATGTFRATTWTKPTADRGMRWLSGSPPVTPHGLLMRENCLGCHAGPGAVRELRTTHPERGNCLQCHVLRRTTETWRRPGTETEARS